MLWILIFFALFNIGNHNSFAAYYSSTVIPSSYKNIGIPEDLVTLSDGSLWYVDSLNYRIVKLNSSGQIVRAIGGQGTGQGEFSNPVRSITKDSSGNLYVLDECHINVFDKYGGFKKSWGSCGGSTGQFNEAKSIHYSTYDNVLLVSDRANSRIVKFSIGGTYIDTFGGAGSGDGQFDWNHGLTTDSEGNIYVVESNNARVQVFTSSGTHIRNIGNSTPGDDSELVAPKDVEVLSNGDILVTSQNSKEIKKFSSTGTFISKWGTDGIGQEQFKAPQYIAKASDGSVWITDWDQRRLQHFSNTGVFLGIVSNSSEDAGKFINPTGVDFDSAGNMYIVDYTGRVQKFNSNGTYISTIINTGNYGTTSEDIAISPITQNIFVSDEIEVRVYDIGGSFINTLGTHGGNGTADGDGDFNTARGMAFDAAGNVYVADSFNHRIQVFDPTHISDPDFDATYQGGFIRKWTTSMEYPTNIYIGVGDTVYVSTNESRDYTNLAIDRYASDGTHLTELMNYWGADEPFQYYMLSSILGDNDGNFYITDNNQNKINIYDVGGSLVETFGSTGSGVDQFDGAKNSKINPVTGDLVVVDRDVHRVKIMSSGVKIKNLITSADVVDVGNSLSLVTSAVDPTDPDVDNITAKLYSGDYIVSDFTVNLTQDRDWNLVNAIILPDESRSLIVNLNPSDAPGVSATHSLYIVKQPGQDSVRVCIAATLIEDVGASCPGYTLNEGDATLSTVSINSIDYWKVEGLTGTGGMALDLIADSTPTPTPTSASSSNSSNNVLAFNNNSGSFTCGNSRPLYSPDLFQINVNSTKAKLFFTPLAETNKYQISFSTKPNAEEHGEEVTLLREGVQSQTVFYLNPNTTYYFKVRGVVGCATGEWSNIMSIKTNSNDQLKTKIFYKSQKNVFVSSIKSLISKINSNPVVDLELPTITASPTTVMPKPTIVSQVKSAPKKTCFLWWCF